MDEHHGSPCRRTRLAWGRHAWHLGGTADYGVFNTIARSRVNARLITRNWDDLLRVADSLHQGMVSSSELMRSILRSKRPSTLARAIAALGRIPKTLYMLSYIDDENYRRRILKARQNAAWCAH
jgi:TnpA family transposase